MATIKVITVAKTIIIGLPNTAANTAPAKYGAATNKYINVIVRPDCGLKCSKSPIPLPIDLKGLDENTIELRPTADGVCGDVAAIGC